MIIDTLIEKIIERQNPTCVGLDTAYDYLPDDMKQLYGQAGAAIAVLLFNKKVIDAVCDVVPAVKVQIAYYEALGVDGLKCFSETCAYAREKGLVVIADCKRNDIGSTAEQYARAFLSKETSCEGKCASCAEGCGQPPRFSCDLLTVNGYLGTDGILPFTALCRENDKGVFVLVKTSNPSSGELQNLRLADGRTVYECMGDMAEKWGEGTLGKYGYSRVGAVVGATYSEEAKNLRARLPHTFFLIPGYGAQGGNAEMLKNCFAAGGMGGIVNNSRGILCAYKKRGGTYFEAARAAALDMQKDLKSVLGEICAK